MPHLSLILLGGFQAHLDGARPLRFSTDKIRALFAYLAVEADRPHRRELLATLFWGDWPDDVALRNLRQSLHRLRTGLEQVAPEISNQILTITRQDVTLHSAALQIDVIRLRAGIVAANQHPHTALAGCVSCVEGLTEAVAHYTGELLAGIGIEDAPEFESWLSRQRESLSQTVLKALADLADAHATRGEVEQSYQYALRQLTLEPWRESAHRQAMRALAANGRRAEALNQYKLCCTLLAEELGVDPEAETTVLYNAIRDASPAPQFARPQSHLPLPLTSFIGRSAELEQIQSLLTKSRLLTLIGAGGSGKTRLALEIGRQLVDVYEDGIYWVELADVLDEQWVPHAVAAALQIPEAPGQPLAAILADALRHRHLLLILDNCEHLLPTCARLVEFLLSRAPQLWVLATSREGLFVGGEQIALVATLSVPDAQGTVDPDDLLAYESVRLFVDRATTHRPDFVLNRENAPHVAQICRQLDGIPLALELAAARTRSLSVAQIAPLLSRRFDLLTDGSRTLLPRQQTLRALIDWSYDLLTGPERILFRRLGIFNGGWNLAAAEGIGADPARDPNRADWPTIDGEPVLHLLGRLVDKSLVQTRDGGDELRYQMLDTIHAYASEQLTGSGELRSLQDRHAHFYTQMAVQANTTVFTGSEVKSLAHLRLDYENLRKALIYTLDQPASPALQSERSAMGIRMAAALGYFWDVYLYLADADHWLRRAWDQVEPTIPARDQADLASGLGTLHWQHSRYREAQRWHESALGHYQSAEDWRGICLSLHHLAVVAMSLGDMEQAVALFQECIRSADVSDQHEIQGLGWVGLGNCYLETDLYDQALLPLERGFAMLHSFNLHRALGYAATSLCDIYLRLNRLDQVVCCIEQIEISANLTGDRALQVAAHTYLTQLLRRQKRLVEAHTAWVKALFLLQEIGVNPHLVNSLEEFALFTLEGEDASAALLLLSACEAYRLSYGVHRPSFFQREIDNAFVRIQRLLPPTTLIELRNQGEGLTLEQALTFTLERVRIPLSSVTDKIRAPD